MLKTDLLKVACFSVLLSFLPTTGFSGDGPVSFDAAKHRLVDVYRNNPVTLYCGCEVVFNRDAGGNPRNSGGVIVQDSCGYQIHSDETRGSRLEWEHIQPMSLFTEHFTFCTSRNQCRENPIYRAIEGNAHNLTLSVGEVNAVRSNYRLVESLGNSASHDYGTFGSCDFRVDSARGLAEPPDHTLGFIARTKLYMADRYGVSFPVSVQEDLVQWHEQYPPTEWEIQRNRLIAAFQGHPNPFTSGERSWVVGSQPLGEGYAALIAKHGDPGLTIEGIAVIRGNRNSKIFHRPDCPSYNAMASRNIVEFGSESEALNAGYRLARNCP